jgi:hypothetical protein
MSVASGVRGVHLSANRSRSGRRIEAWGVAWIDKNGRRRAVRFAWNRYGGRSAALEEARKFREAHPWRRT